MTYTSTKTYGHEIGLSCCFRQWKATHSHCSFLHGYAVSVRLEFTAERLDDKNWVVDFGGLKQLKKTLQDTFDHKTLVAIDDPSIDWFRQAETLGLLDMKLVSHTGCEAFAELVWEQATEWLFDYDKEDRVFCSLVEVKEHGANSAIFRP